MVLYISCQIDNSLKFPVVRGFKHHLPQLILLQATFIMEGHYTLCKSGTQHTYFSECFPRDLRCVGVSKSYSYWIKLSVFLFSPWRKIDQVVHWGPSHHHRLKGWERNLICLFSFFLIISFIYISNLSTF